MADGRAFVYVVCGSASHVRTLHRSLEYLRPRTACEIIVVTDSGRNEMPIEHDAVVDVETPQRFDAHQASIFLKTRLHRILPAGRHYAYLDSDVIAVDTGVDAIFEHQYGPVTFAHDLTRLENRVSTFSPWAVRCGCADDEGIACGHLADAIDAKFQVRVPDDWLHWNGGVFLFGPDAAPFMDTWHRLTLEIFDDPYWRTRDQGTLIATVWKHGLQDQRCLPPQFDFIVDHNNPDLYFDRTTGYALHELLPGIRPSFLHLYHAELDRPGWSLAVDVEDRLDKRAHADQTGESGESEPAEPSASGDASAHNLPMPVSGSKYEVIVGVPCWSVDQNCQFAETLVRGLLERGTSAQVLLTEVDITHVTNTMPAAQQPADLPFVEIPAAKDASWGTRWGTLVRYLEERAPCIYVPAGDWRHSNVSPHLSNGVRVVGIVPDQDPRHLDHVERLGRYWNVIVAPSQDLAASVTARYPDLASRVEVIPDGVAGYAALFDTLMAPDSPRTFCRLRGLLHKPPYRVADTVVFPIPYFRGVRDVGVFPSYREDYDDYRRAAGEAAAQPLPVWQPELARMYPAIVAARKVPDSAADDDVASLVSGLRRMDQPGHVLVESGAATARESGRFGRDVPVQNVRSGPVFWRSRRRAVVSHLERHAPCFYFPDDEGHHASVLSRLSNEIGVIARIDDVGPRSLERVESLSRFWNAVVVGSDAVAERLREIDPALSPRVFTIPFAVVVPDQLAERALSWGTTVHVAVAGPVPSGIDAALAAAGIGTELIRADGPAGGGAERAEVLVVFSDPNRVSRLVLEAMGRGCVPVVAQGRGLISDLVTDGRNGYVMPNADMTAILACVRALRINPALRQAIAIRAFLTARTVCKDMAEDMTARYAMLFERVLRDIEFGTFRRPTQNEGTRARR